jgi:hypothetical protein
MKKILTALTVMTLLFVSANASQINWGNDPEIYDWSGSGNLVLETYTDNYVIRLYESTNNVIDFGRVGNIATNYADDIWSGLQFNWASAGGDGFGTADLNGSDTIYGIDDGDKIYSVIFNSVNVANQTGAFGYFAIIDDAPKTVTYSGGMMTYNPGGLDGGLTSAGGGWQAVPEPATALLFGIGGMGAWLFRRNKLKSKEEADA